MKKLFRKSQEFSHKLQISMLFAFSENCREIPTNYVSKVRLNMAKRQGNMIFPKRYQTGCIKVNQVTSGRVRTLRPDTY